MSKRGSLNEGERERMGIRTKVQRQRRKEERRKETDEHLLFTYAFSHMHVLLGSEWGVEEEEAERSFLLFVSRMEFKDRPSQRSPRVCIWWYQGMSGNGISEYLRDEGNEEKGKKGCSANNMSMWSNNEGKNFSLLIQRFCEVLLFVVRNPMNDHLHTSNFNESMSC